MKQGLTRDEDTALRCLTALAEGGSLTEEYAGLLADLRARDRRAKVRHDGTVVPTPRNSADDVAPTTVTP